MVVNLHKRDIISDGEDNTDVLLGLGGLGELDATNGHGSGLEALDENTASEGDELGSGLLGSGGGLEKKD